MGAVWDRLSALPDGKASRTSWPGSLVERALALLAAVFRRPAGPFVLAAVSPTRNSTGVRAAASTNGIANPRRW